MNSSDFSQSRRRFVTGLTSATALGMLGSSGLLKAAHLSAPLQK